MLSLRPGEGQVLTLSHSGRQAPEGSVNAHCAHPTSQRDRPIGHILTSMHVYTHMYVHTCVQTQTHTKRPSLQGFVQEN